MMNNFEFDTCIIGSGPGGYVSAIRSAQLGLKTCIVERYDKLGGTCLNVGCIPSKALLDSSKRFSDLQENQKYGISIKGDVTIDPPAFFNHKNQLVGKLNKGIEMLMKKNKIVTLFGHASFIDEHTLSIEGHNQKIRSKHFIIATGSKPSIPSFVISTSAHILSSTSALCLEKIPKHLIVIGSGAIGLEFALIYGRLGSKISVIETMDRICPNMDGSLSKNLKPILEKKGMVFYLGHFVNTINEQNGEVSVNFSNALGKTSNLSGDYCLIATGRKAYTEGLGLERLSIASSEGQISVNEVLQTTHKHIYAIGDVIGGAMLAHKAEEEGVFVAEHIAGQRPHINYRLIPSVIYTYPEAASVGYTEEKLIKKGVPYNKGLFNFSALGRAIASGSPEGFIKVLTDQVTDEIIGVHMLANHASDMIAEAVVAMEFKASAEDIARICHPHPSYTEAFKEACLSATENRSIHS